MDDAAELKAKFLAAVAKGEEKNALISRTRATELLGTMLGGYNVKPLIDLLGDAEVGVTAANALKHTLLMFDFFHDVVELAKSGSAIAKANAQAVMQSWADAEWFTTKPALPEKVTVTVFKVTGETNTDDLSPAPDAWSRPDIPLHALAMLKNPRDGITPDKPGEVGPITFIQSLKSKGHPIAYVGDVVGTGSSRKSATNSVLWWTGDDIPYVPNKRYGGFCLAARSRPSSSTPRKTPAPCLSNAMSPISTWAMSSISTRSPARSEKNGRVDLKLQLQVRRAAGRSACRRPHQPHYRPWPDRACA